MKYRNIKNIKNGLSFWCLLLTSYDYGLRGSFLRIRTPNRCDWADIQR